ncbi:K(+)-stimulated pyrophosphate-energized sodium pump [Oxobacter pfennigii]|uniref:K(+)-stimulated pyrophosphate-energized sodium pump n=1 Tax=Oxobacter pfennigii TaxID=36849 RepID=A0A0P8W6K0_9CLOT|nr:sodium-translocating pyrophosphatase [Oxobacter pfennigii]KPU44326.1 K(+)-stimulated pyrophosphate-energized sodium pump [Oxobacter pfennigii]
MFYISLMVGLFAIAVAFGILFLIKKEPKVSSKIAEIAGYIATGARAYLKRQIKTISLVTPLLFFILLFLFNWKVAAVSVLGVFTSLLGSIIGMASSTLANSKVTSACAKSSDKAFRLAVFGGSITGFSVTGLSVLVLSILYLIFKDYQIVIGFGFGASLAALFAQIGGGIYTKSADIGADLVGKVENNLPEDDPRNPAVIADLVGDNVGDCAGRGADLFESFSNDIITGTLVASTLLSQYGPKAIFLPLILQATGILASMIGILITKKWGKNMAPSTSFNLGLIVTAVIASLGGLIVVKALLPDLSVWMGILLGVTISLIATVSTRYYAGMEGKPVKEMAEASKAGPAINIIVGLSNGLQSPIASIIMIVIAIIAAYTLSGGSLFVIVAVNLGTDLMIAYIMAADTFGPITDNASGIAEMSHAPEELVEKLSSLDSVGNTMKAITKAYSMSSGTITAFVIFTTFFALTKNIITDISNPYTTGFMLIGISLPFLISSLAIKATAKGAFLMVDEVRRQFREIKGLLTGEASPDYGLCIDITTKNALKQMILPGIVSVFIPVVVGFTFGPKALGPLLIGSVLCSAVLGPFFNNTGTAYDNAKKTIELNRELKGTLQHQAAVIGDTVGDPMKDVAGPSILIFMKLVGMSALLIAPLII